MLISPVGLHGGYGRQLPRVAECRPDANFIDLVNTALGFTRHSQLVERSVARASSSWVSSETDGGLTELLLP